MDNFFILLLLQEIDNLIIHQQIILHFGCTNIIFVEITICDIKIFEKSQKDRDLLEMRIQREEKKLKLALQREQERLEEHKREVRMVSISSRLLTKSVGVWEFIHAIFLLSLIFTFMVDKK